MTCGQIHHDSFTGRVAAFIDHHGLLEQGASVLAAVSGGADSVALLAALVDLAGDPARAYHLVVAHLNHGMAMQAEEDSEFMAELTARLHVPLIFERVDVPALAKQTGDSLELAARQARYEFLRAAARQADCPTIATGHQADDNVETVLHRILRGTGLAGLRGIRPKRKLQSPAGELWLVRPMLAVTRAEGEAYVAGLGLRWRTDPTNADKTHCTRNRIRHELLPLLRRQYNPQVDRAITRLATLAEWAGPQLDEFASRSLEPLIVEKGEGRLVLTCAGLMQEDQATAAQVVRAALARMGVPLRGIGLDHVQAVCDLLARPAGTTGVDLPGSLRVLREYDRLVFQVNQPANAADQAAAVALSMDGKTDLPDGCTLGVTVRPGGMADLAGFRAHKPAGEEMLDADHLAPPLIARRWLPGDRVRPLGAPGSQKLSDFFGSAKIPTDARRHAWIICDSHGAIWVAPHRIAHRVRVTATTAHLALLRLQPPERT